jgi:hypothetical protein
MSTTPAVREHDFTLILSGPAELTTELEDALFAAGCDDATLSVRGGRVYLDFTRSAASREDAVRSAVRDVRGAGRDVLAVERGGEAG